MLNMQEVMGIDNPAAIIAVAAAMSGEAYEEMFPFQCAAAEQIVSENSTIDKITFTFNAKTGFIKLEQT
jgi:hypothetical protein